MATLDQIRREVPWAQGMSDDDLIKEISTATGSPADVIAERFGRFKGTRNPLAVANDLAIETANAAAGGAKSMVDFVAPGTGLSKGIQGFIDKGEQSQSYKAQRAKRELGESLESDEFIPQAKGVGKYVWENPGLATAQAVGSFAGPGLGIKAARGISGLRNYATKEAAEAAAVRAGTGVGMGMSGAMSGGDAAGNAYDLVMNSPYLAHLSEEERHEKATSAARMASIAPAIYGTLTGALGAEGALARNSSKGILRTGAVEALSETGDEGISAYSGRKSASQYDPTINPWQGVAGSALLGGALGGISGGAVGALTREQAALPPPPSPLDDKTRPTDLLTGEVQYTPEELDAEFARKQRGLFTDGDLSANEGPRRPPPPNYTPDLFDPDQSIGLPPVEYTNAPVDPQFAAAQAAEQAKAQAAAVRAARKAGVAAPVVPGAAAPVAPVDGDRQLMMQVQEAYLNSGALAPEDQALLASEPTTKADKDAKKSLITRIKRFASVNASGAVSVEDVADALHRKIMKAASSGKQTDRALGETHLMVLNSLLGTPEDQRLTLNDYAAANMPATAAPVEGQQPVNTANTGTAPAPIAAPGRDASKGAILRRPSAVPAEEPELARTTVDGTLPLDEGYAPTPPQYPSSGRPDEPPRGMDKSKKRLVQVQKPPVQAELPLEGGEGTRAGENAAISKETTKVSSRKARELELQDTEAQVQAFEEVPVSSAAAPTDIATEMTATEAISSEAHQFSKEEKSKSKRKLVGKPTQDTWGEGAGHGESQIEGDSAANNPEEVLSEPLTRLLTKNPAGVVGEDGLNEFAYKLVEHAANSKSPAAQKRIAAKLEAVQKEIKRRAELRKKEEKKPKKQSGVQRDERGNLVSEEGQVEDNVPNVEQEFAEQIGEGDAVQERGAEALDAQEQSGDGEGVGEQDTGGQEAAGPRPAEAQERRSGQAAKPAQDEGTAGTQADAQAAKPAGTQKTEVEARGPAPRFYDDVKVDFLVYDEETGAYESSQVTARAALDSLKQDLKKMRALMNCVKGG